jgi:hypothetical protein
MIPPWEIIEIHASTNNPPTHFRAHDPNLSGCRYYTTMSESNTPNSRFAPSNATTEDLLKSQTVGLVELSDFRKRRAEVLEQNHRERTLGSGTVSGASTPKDG